MTTTTASSSSSNKRLYGDGLLNNNNNDGSGLGTSSSTMLLGAIDENAPAASSSLPLLGGGGGNKKADISLDNIDWNSKESFEIFLRDLDDALNVGISKEINDVEKHAIMSIDTIVSSYLMKLTKSTKQMTCDNFEKKHGLNLIHICEEIIKENSTYQMNPNDNGSTSTTATTATTTTKTIRNNETDEYGRPLRTPARMANFGSTSSITGGLMTTTSGARTPATIVKRAPQRGEIMYSAKGSPIGVAGDNDDAQSRTVAAAGSSNNNTNDDNDEQEIMLLMSKKKTLLNVNGTNQKVPSLEINLGNGIKVDIRDTSTIQNMDEETAIKMKQHVESLQYDLSTFLGNLGLNSTSKKSSNNNNNNSNKGV